MVVIKHLDLESYKKKQVINRKEKPCYAIKNVQAFVLGCKEKKLMSIELLFKYYHFLSHDDFYIFYAVVFKSVCLILYYFQVRRWKKKIEDECGNIPMVLVQNKMDLLYNSAVDRYMLVQICCSGKDFLYLVPVRQDKKVYYIYMYEYGDDNIKKAKL